MDNQIIICPKRTVSSNRCISNKTYNKKIRLAKSRTLYYANTVTTLRLILSGYVPGNKQKSSTCSACNKTIFSNSKKTYCTICRSITHLRYITSNKNILSTSIQDWICSFCIQSVLLFHKVRDLHTLDSWIHNEYETIEHQNKHLDVLKKHHCYTSVTHLNTQSLPSSFDKFSYMMNNYKFDIVTLSETWLKNNKTQLEYVQIDGYKSEFKNREPKFGGGLGFYIKEHMSFNVRHDLGKTD